MTVVRTRRSQRISSEEEQRVRSGYDVSTHYRFPRFPPRSARVTATDGEQLLSITVGPSAEIWRINNDQRRTTTPGFQIDPDSGSWASSDGQADDEERSQGQLLAGVRLFVQDTRNLLLIRPESLMPTEQAEAEKAWHSLLYALRRGVEYEFQTEEQEIAAELIGRGPSGASCFGRARKVGSGFGTNSSPIPERSRVSLGARSGSATSTRRGARRQAGMESRALPSAIGVWRATGISLSIAT